MSSFNSFKIIPKFLVFTAFLGCFPSLAETQSNNLQIASIITVKEEAQKDEEKSPPAPGLSFGVPSAYGASDNSLFVGISYGASVEEGLFTFYSSKENKNKVADGSMNFGLGVGDPNQLAAEISVGIISLLCQDGESCFGSDGTMGIKLHKKLDNSFLDGVAIGYSDLVRWGEASDFATVYGVTSKDFKINNKNGLLSLGIGTGGFRSKADIDSNENNPNIFGGIGVQLAPRLSLSSGWNGSILSSGLGISPFDFPLSVSVGITDITDVNGSGQQFSINLGYSYSF